MKAKPDWSEIEGRTDFGNVNAKLAEFAMSGAGRRKTAADLLGKVKDGLLQARSEGASYRRLAAFLRESGLPVSEPTLRQCLSAQGAGKRVRGKKAGANRSVPNAQPPRESQEGKAAQPEQPAPTPQPSLAAIPPAELPPVREPWKSRARGPRIADVNNL